MAPMHGSPHGTVRIVLVEKMVFVIVIHQPIRVVHPVRFGCEVKERAVWFALRGFVLNNVLLLGAAERVGCIKG